MKKIAIFSILFIFFLGPPFAQKNIKVEEKFPFQIFKSEKRSLVLISMRQLINEIKNVNIVYFGEIHDSLWQHKAMSDILNKAPKRALGLELIEKPKQIFLDKYLSHKKTLREFYKDIKWQDKKQNSAYSYIFEYARKNAAAYGINLPIKKIREIKSRDIYQCDFSSTYYRFIYSIFERDLNTPQIPKHNEALMKTMCYWNEVMADNAIKILDKEKKLAIITGQFHIIFNGGIPAAVEKRNNKISQKTVFFWDEQLELLKKETVGDYLIITR